MLKKLKSLIFINFLFFFVLLSTLTFLFGNYELIESNQKSHHPSLSSKTTKSAFIGKEISTSGINKIYFIESNMKRDYFSLKQLCSIESAAKNNPNFLIQVYTLRASLNPSMSFLLKKYSNIKIIDFKTEEIFGNESSFVEFWSKGDIMRSPYAHAHLSDFIR